MRNTIKKILKEEASNQEIKFYNFVMNDLKSKTTINKNDGGDVYNVDVASYNLPYYVIMEPRFYMDEVREFNKYVTERYGSPKIGGISMSTDYIFWLKDLISNG